MKRPTAGEALPSLRRLVGQFRPYLKGERGLLVGGFGALFAQVPLRLLEPWPLKVILDRVLGETPGNAGGLTLNELLLAASLGLIAVVTLRALAEYFGTVCFALLGNRVLTRVRAEVYAHLQRLPLAYHSGTRGGDLTMRIVADVGLLKEVAVTAGLPLLGNVFVLLGMVGVMLWLDAGLALLSLGVLPLFWLLSQRQTRRIREVARRERGREGAIAATVAESLGAIKLVQALSLERVFDRLFAEQNQQSLRDGVKAKRLAAGLERTTDVLVALATAVVLYAGARRVLAGALTPGELVVFVTYLKSAFKPVRDFAKYAGRLAKASAAAERVLAILGTEPTIRDGPAAVPAPAFRGELCFERVSFGYDPDKPVLSDFSLHVRAGETVALVGESGGGKSTLASLLPRLYDPDSGRVLIDGGDVRGYTLASLRGQLSLVLQDTVLFGAPVRDNLLYGAPPLGEAEVEAAARLAGAHEFIVQLPEGYDTVLGERGATLSGGQRQRLAVARAALRRAPVLILDEPTVGLDEENERLVRDAVEALRRGRTTLLITHDLSLAARADRVVYLEAGRVSETGSHTELLRRGGRYAALYRLQTTRQEAHGYVGA